jgi:hypothetical protein
VHSSDLPAEQPAALNRSLAGGASRGVAVFPKECLTGNQQVPYYKYGTKRFRISRWTMTRFSERWRTRAVASSSIGFTGEMDKRWEIFAKG